MPGGTIELGRGAVANFDDGIANQTFIFTGPGTITRSDPHDVSQVKLPAHSIIIAEAAAVATYLDTGNRGAFANSWGKAWGAPVFGRGGQWNACAVADLCLNGPVLRTIRAEIFQRILARRFILRPATRHRGEPGKIRGPCGGTRNFGRLRLAFYESR
ncbi:MAG: hypothetical protein B7Z75_03745 [Acidocella sp. 20-57-95]|nr:MAG: hypothetical protein B7Z75_03745 [Acidocella sp. 20-57-95]OYV62307.1 MAG: hypothetical protein B7Z71_01720 [Acidocella sp. 21-58-7]HQT63959.1 hypothetical protein [Acidocella sp.]HQU03248.1 hypothetical protein [Acidocella sp.]